MARLLIKLGEVQFVHGGYYFTVHKLDMRIWIQISRPRTSLYSLLLICFCDVLHQCCLVIDGLLVSHDRTSETNAHNVYRRRLKKKACCVMLCFLVFVLLLLLLVTSERDPRCITRLCQAKKLILIRALHVAALITTSQATSMDIDTVVYYVLLFMLIVAVARC
jgi:cytochrome bd-type quinol oxidase subunit 2